MSGCNELGLFVLRYFTSNLIRIICYSGHCFQQSVREGILRAKLDTFFQLLDHSGKRAVKELESVQPIDFTASSSTHVTISEADRVARGYFFVLDLLLAQDTLALTLLAMEHSKSTQDLDARGREPGSWRSSYRQLLLSLTKRGPRLLGQGQD